MLDEFQDGFGPELKGAMDGPVVARDDEGEVAIFARQAQAIRQRLDERNAAFLVPPMARPLLARRGALAEIVHQGGEPDLGLGTQACGLVEHHQDMHPRIDLRVPLHRLRYAEQRVDFRIYRLQRAAGAQYVEKFAALLFAQSFFGFLPYSLRYPR